MRTYPPDNIPQAVHDHYESEAERLATEPQHPLNASETEALMCIALLSEPKMEQWYAVVKKFNELKKDPAPALAAIGRRYAGTPTP